MSKIALVTGASSGIGKSTALLLAKNGYNLIINGRREERLKALKKQLRSEFKVDVLTMVLDVRNETDVKQYFESLASSWKNIDLLINNAGLAAGLETIENGDSDNWNRMIDTNIKGLLYVSQSCIPLLKSTRGHIINIGSIAGKEVYMNGNVYCGTKHMVDALNKALRIELAEAGVRVSSVNPGAVETEFSLVRLDWDHTKANSVYEGFENLVAEDIADAVVYIASRPAHVNINELTIMPTAQPVASTIIRNKGI